MTKNDSLCLKSSKLATLKQSSLSWRLHSSFFLTSFMNRPWWHVWIRWMSLLKAVYALKGLKLWALKEIEYNYLIIQNHCLSRRRRRGLVLLTCVIQFFSKDIAWFLSTFYRKSRGPSVWDKRGKGPTSGSSPCHGISFVTWRHMVL